MLNPSTADATVNDPTITRCMNLAASHGFGGLEVVNLFAFRSTRPRDLWQAGDPVGLHNDEHIKRALHHSDACLLAWGNLPPSRLERARAILKFIPAAKKLFCLGMTKMQQPRHPLYLANDLALETVSLEASREGIILGAAETTLVQAPQIPQTLISTPLVAESAEALGRTLTQEAPEPRKI